MMEASDVDEMLGGEELHAHLAKFAIAVGVIGCLHVAIAGLYITLPGRQTKGYVVDSRGEPLQYKLSGLPTMLVCIALYVLVVYFEDQGVESTQAAAAEQTAANKAARDAETDVSSSAWSTYLIADYWYVLSASCLLGILGSLVPYVLSLAPSAGRRGEGKSTFARDEGRRAPTLGMTEEQRQRCALPPPNPRTELQYFFEGSQFNPRILINPSSSLYFDWKMYGYIYGAVLLVLLLLSGVRHYFLSSNMPPLLLLSSPDPVTTAVITYALMMLWFVLEYVWFENVHLFTYDFFQEKVGFKILWGCFFFYPFFYTIGMWPLVLSLPAATIATTSASASAPFSAANDGVDGFSAAQSEGAALPSEQRGHTLFDWFSTPFAPHHAALVFAMFLCGWVLTRGANLQKYAFKRWPQKPFLGIPPETVQGSPHILISGFWRYARHVNYLGEIVQAIAVALPAVVVSGSALPLLYPLYYVVLLVPRQIEDDRVCAIKYGDAWVEYTGRVPFRIVPFFY